MAKDQHEPLTAVSDSDSPLSAEDEPKSSSSQWRRLGLTGFAVCVVCGLAGFYSAGSPVQITSHVNLADAPVADAPPVVNETPDEGAKDCNCKSKWTFKGVDYDGCAATPTDPKQNWCYVEGGENCKLAKDSLEAGETQKWRDCDACNCQIAWDYKGTSYAGCATSPGFDKNWCYVQGGKNCKQSKAAEDKAEVRTWRECSACNCMTEWNYDGKVLNGCAETEDFPGKTWCYVQGSKNCKQSSVSELAGEAKQWRLCSACNCMDQWNYQEKTYEGCSVTDKFPNTPTCYVQGGAACDRAKKSEEVGEKKMWRNCNACNCLDAWNYKGKVYEGCAKTPGFAESGWCYVQGGKNCNQGQKSTEVGEKKLWRPCAKCNCMVEWNYKVPGEEKSKTYNGCDKTANYDKKWCFVQGGATCGDSSPSTDAAENKQWRYCHACACMDQWNFKGEFYKGCTKTPGYEKNWCYVQGGKLCKQKKLLPAKDSAEPGETKKWIDCKSCACMNHWEWNDKTYKGCTKTDDSKFEWCYVIGYGGCEAAQDSEKMKDGEDRKWLKCGKDA